MSNMNENDKKLNENFIKCQTKQAFKNGICLYAGCEFKNKLTFNLKRHMKSCEFSPGRVEYRRRIGEVNEIIEVTPVNVFENPAINMNIKNSWGYAYQSKLVDLLDYNFKMNSKKTTNIVNQLLKQIISSGRLQQSLKLIDNSIHIYNDCKWINNKDNEFKPVLNKIKELWYKKIKQVLGDNNMLWINKIGLMQKVATDIGKEWLYTEDHCHKLIDEVLEDQFEIKRVTIVD